MRTYVINLPRAADRRQFMEAQLANSSLDWEFVEGVEGRSLSSNERSSLVDQTAVERWPTWLTPGAIGCILSHKRVYERVAADKSNVALVLEDDALVSGDLVGLTSEIAVHMRLDDVVLLYFRSFRPCRLHRANTTRVGDFKLFRPADPDQPISALAYLVGREAATKMAELIAPVRWAADKWSEYVNAGAVGSLRCVLPRPVIQAPTISSTIGHGESLSPHQRLLDTWGMRRARQLNRQRVAWRMQRIEFVD